MGGILDFLFANQNGGGLLGLGGYPSTNVPPQFAVPGFQPDQMQMPPQNGGGLLGMGAPTPTDPNTPQSYNPGGGAPDSRPYQPLADQSPAPTMPGQPPQQMAQPAGGILNSDMFARQVQSGRGGLFGAMFGNEPNRVLDGLHGALSQIADPEGKQRQQAIQNYVAFKGLEDKQKSAADFGGAVGGMFGQQPGVPGAPPMSPPGGMAMPGPQAGMPPFGQPSAAPSSAFAMASDGGLGPPATPQPQGGPLAYNAKLTNVESGGDPNARNPNSSAAGLVQFTDGTWLENFNKTFPAQASMPDPQKLALRSNPQVVTPVLNTFTQANEQKLTSAGIPITDMTRYAAHFFGADDATKVLKADPNVPLANLVQAASIKANPFLANMTAGQAQEWIAGKMGGGAPAAKGVPNDPMSSPASMNPGGLIKALSNPNLPEGLRKTGEMMFQNYLDQSKMTNDQKEYLWAKAQGYHGGFSDYQKEMKAAGGTNVTVNTAGEKSYNQKTGGGYGEVFNDLQTQGRKSFNATANLQTLLRLSDNPDLYTGTLNPVIGTVRKAMVSAGITDADKMAPNELFSALANKTVLDAAGGSLGTGFSNADRDYLSSTVANANNTKEGNKAIVQTALAVEQRKRDVAKMARDYAKSHGDQIDAGFDEHLAQWAEKNPLFQSQAGSSQGGGGQQNMAPPPVPGAQQGRDGNFYMPDPQRPGKYLKVTP